MSLIEDRIRKETSVEYLTIELDRLGLDSREKAKACRSAIAGGLTSRTIPMNWPVH